MSVLFLRGFLYAAEDRDCARSRGVQSSWQAQRSLSIALRTRHGVAEKMQPGRRLLRGTNLTRRSSGQQGTSWSPRIAHALVPLWIEPS
jgi:hypothetical protein